MLAEPLADLLVAGPRIDPDSLVGRAPIDGLEVVPYAHNLYRHLAACDLAVVPGGLTTTMELTANKRPFLYFPLRRHFEQNFTSATAWNATGPVVGWITTTPHQTQAMLAGAVKAAQRIAGLL